MLNVQSDLDFIHREINWDEILRAYKSLDIKIKRYPIFDFNQEDLIEKLKGAGDLLKILVDEGHVVYVHCTAGMSRAAATVIIYMILYHSYNLDEAYDYVKSYREVICPNMKAIAEVVNRNTSWN